MKVWVLLLADFFCKPDAGSGDQFMAVRSHEDVIIEPVLHNDPSKKSITEQKYNIRFWNFTVKIYNFH